MNVGRNRMKLVRLWLPVAIIAAGLILIIARRDDIGAEGGALLISAGLSVWLLNLLYRIGVKGAMTAEICRITVTEPAPKTPACTLVTRLPVQPGPTHAAEALPPALTVDPPHLLAYRVQVFNVHGHSAGLSPEAFAASGTAPPPPKLVPSNVQ